MSIKTDLGRASGGGGFDGRASGGAFDWGAGGTN